MEFVSVRRAIKNGSMRKKILNESEKLNDQFLEKQKIIFERYRKFKKCFNSAKFQMDKAELVLF